MPPAGRISRREWIAAVALLWLAFTLRTADLTRVPPGLHNDEVVAASLAERVMNGEWRIFYPGDTGSEPLHYFFSAPIMWLFGSTIFALRLPSIALSLIAMSVVWALARRLFGPIAAMAALAGFAITFWTVAFGRIVSPVAMLVPLGALSAYFFWRAFSTAGRRAWVLWAFSGLWLGLSVLSYTAARILPPIFAAFGAYVWLARRPGWRRWWSGIAITIAVAAVVSAPMFIYLARNPAADQLDFFDIDRPLRELRLGNVAPAIGTTLRTLGMFAFTGDELPYYTIPGRPIFEPVGASLLLVGVLVCCVRWRKPEYAFVVMWFFLSLVPGMLSQPAPNSTRTLGAQVVVFTLIGIGVAELLRKTTETQRHGEHRQKKPSVFSVSLWLIALIFIGNLIWTVRDYFVVWPSIDTVRYWHNAGLKAVADRVQADPDTSPVALCLPDELIDERTLWWKPGWQHMRYLLHRPDVSIRYYNCADALVFIDGPARYAIPDAADVNALDVFPIYSQFIAASDPTLDLLPDRLGIIARADLSAVLDSRLANVAPASIVLFPPEAGGGSAQLPITFGNSLELIGYMLAPSSLIPHPSSFELTTYWRVTSELPPQLTQFTHVLNDRGEVIAQQDRLALTSASLKPGDVFAQIHRLTLPEDLPDGEYALSIGLYTPSDGARLPIVQNGQVRGDRLMLQTK